MARGLMVYPMGGTIDGTQGDHVLLAPPFIVTEDQIGEIVDRLGSALDDALAQGVGARAHHLILRSGRRPRLAAPKGEVFAGFNHSG